MRMTGYHAAARPRFDVQMTPMIDVVFQLLIFFVCTVSFRKPEQSLPATPRAAAATAATSASIAATELEDLPQIDLRLRRRDGRTVWLVNADECRGRSDVERRLQSAARSGDTKQRVPVVLNVADDVPLADAVDVYDLCLVIGFERVQFTTDAEERK